MFTTTFYRVQSTDRPNILDPQFQTSSSWNDLGDDDRIRRGVSACNTREELATYLAESAIPFSEDWELLEVEGYYSDDEDEDADRGAVLIIPTAIISRERVGDGFDLEVFAAFDEMEENVV